MAGRPGSAPGEGQPDEEELRARMDELREQLAGTPAAAVVANHCYGLFELATLHLSLQPPQLDQAGLAIDALGQLIEGLAGRLGTDEAALRDGLAQLRIAFVQVGQSARSAGQGPAGGDAARA